MRRGRGVLRMASERREWIDEADGVMVDVGE